MNIHSGPATFLPSSSPELGSLISSQLTASSVAPVVPDTAKRTPSEFCAVERKSVYRVKIGLARNRERRETRPSPKERTRARVAEGNLVKEEVQF